MTYSFTCPACGHVTTCDAMTDNEALGKMMELGGVHMKDVHPDMPATPEDQMKEMVRTGMTHTM